MKASAPPSAAPRKGGRKLSRQLRSLSAAVKEKREPPTSSGPPYTPRCLHTLLTSFCVAPAPPPRIAAAHARAYTRPSVGSSPAAISAARPQRASRTRFTTGA
jgi:hypothetical protein